MKLKTHKTVKSMIADILGPEDGSGTITDMVERRRKRTFGLTLSLFRIKLGLHYETLSLMMGKPREWIAQIEDSEDSEISIQDIKHISKVLDNIHT